jgi:hypothetical protein
MGFRTFSHFKNETIKARALTELSDLSSGCNEFNSLLFSGAVVDGDNFTIGSVKFVIKQLNSGSLTLADSTLNNTKAGDIKGVGITAHGLSVNHLFLVGSEYFKVTRVGDANTVDVTRGYAGSTVAAHTSGASVLVAANYTSVVLASDVLIPVGATLAIATTGPLIVTALNAFGAAYSAVPAPVAKVKALGVTAEYVAAGTQVLLTRVAQGNTMAMTETITNATLYAATFSNGVQRGDTKLADVTRVPTAAEVTAGYVDFSFPFPVKGFQLSAVTTSTRASATIGSTISYSTDFTRVRLTNNATNDFAATHTLRVSVWG